MTNPYRFKGHGFARQHTTPDRINIDARIGCVNVERRHVEEFLAGVAQALARYAVDLQESPRRTVFVNLVDDYSIGDRIEQGSVVFLAVARRFLSLIGRFALDIHAVFTRYLSPNEQDSLRRAAVG